MIFSSSDFGRWLIYEHDIWSGWSFCVFGGTPIFIVWRGAALRRLPPPGTRISSPFTLCPSYFAATECLIKNQSDVSYSSFFLVELFYFSCFVNRFSFANFFFFFYVVRMEESSLLNKLMLNLRATCKYVVKKHQSYLLESVFGTHIALCPEFWYY